MALQVRSIRPRMGLHFNPRNIANIEGWWDASDAASVTLDSGRVSTWKDKSGNGRDVSNSTSGSTQPAYQTADQNGRNNIRFVAASSQFLAASTASDWKFLHAGDSTVFIAGDFVAAFSTLLSTITANETGTGMALYLNSTGRFGIVNRVLNSSSAITVNTGTLLYSNNTALIAEFVMRPTNATAGNRAAIGVNDAASNLSNTLTTTPSTSNPTQPLHMAKHQGGTLPASFDAYEIIMYSRELGSAEKTAIRRHLYAKWGVTGT